MLNGVERWVEVGDLDGCLYSLPGVKNLPLLDHPFQIILL